MIRTIKYTCIAIFGLALIALAVGPAWAIDYKRLSKHHTVYGVSQFIAAAISPNERNNTVVKLMNPTPVTMVAAAFIYEREGGNRGGIPEKFLGCVLETLPPHAAVQIEYDAYFRDNINPDGKPMYIEVISVPVEPVTLWSHWKRQRNSTRLADGLGIVGTPNNFQGNLFVLHPKLFSLPSNIDGQREEAAKSICTELLNKGLSPDLFEEFGIFCP